MIKTLVVQDWTFMSVLRNAAPHALLDPGMP